MGCLLDKETLPPPPSAEFDSEYTEDHRNHVTVAVIGPPKVGKSSLIYRFLYNLEVEPPTERQSELFAVTDEETSLDGILTKKKSKLGSNR